MSFESGTAPRRLLQTHGAFINAVLAPNLKQKRQYNVGAPLHLDETGSTPATNHNKRLNAAMKFVSNDEVFDAREGEILVYSQTESGFPAHRRGALFSSLNGYKVKDVKQIQPAANSDPYKQMLKKTDPRDALHESDLRYVGLCQNSFVSSNTALAEQGMAVQVSGIKTIINDSEESKCTVLRFSPPSTHTHTLTHAHTFSLRFHCVFTFTAINIGDKLMVDTMQKVPSKVRKGIPNEKVRLVLRKVPQGFVPKTALDKTLEKIKAARARSDFKYGGETIRTDDNREYPSTTDDIVRNIAALVITEFRKAGHWVVGVAENSARHGEQLDVLLTKPSFL